MSIIWGFLAGFVYLAFAFFSGVGVRKIAENKFGYYGDWAEDITVIFILSAGIIIGFALLK